MRKVIGAIVALAFAGPALAQEMMIPTELTVRAGFAEAEVADSFELDGSAYGIAAAVSLPYGVYLNLSYDLNSTDEGNADLDVDEGRFGVGYQQPLPYDMKIGVDLNYATIDTQSGTASEDATGIAINVKFGVDLAPNCDFYARIGYVSYDDDDFDVSGPDVLAGIGIQLTGNMRLLLDYRSLQLSNNDTDLDIDNIRAGLRFEL